MKINKKIIEELVDYLKEFNLTEIEYSEDKTKIRLKIKRLIILLLENKSLLIFHRKNWEV